MLTSLHQPDARTGWLNSLRIPGLILLACVIFWFGGLRPIGFPISTLLFGYAGVAVARTVLAPRAWVDLVLAGLLGGVASLLLVAEALSLVGLLGSPRAWVNGAGVCALVGYAVTRRWPRPWPRRPAGLRPQLPWLAWVLLIVFATQLGTMLILTGFAGINIYDSQSTYIPRSVRYLQNGTLNVYDTFFDTTPYLHQMLVAHQIVFLRSDALVNPLSFATCLAIGLGLYALARSLRWGTWIALLSACLPFTMAVFIIHASSSNFDTLEALFLLLALYCLRRGAPGSEPRWLIFAAVATGLACATKPTFWFAVPGLGLIWLAVTLRSLVRRRLAFTARWLAPCILVIMLLGTPYLIRNTIIRGHPLGAEPVEAVIMGPSLSLGERLQRVVYMDFVMAVSLLTPPFLLGSLALEPLDAWFRSTATAIGFDITDPRWSMYPSWQGALRHTTEPYAGDHAYFGSGVLLVIVPAIVALLLGWRRLDGRRWILAACVLFGASYLVTLGAVSRYHISLGRYLIEMVVVLAAVAPVLFWLLPRRLAVAYATVVSVVLLADMRDVILHNRSLPIDRVTTVPRDVQFHYFFGSAIARATPLAMRELNEKYPVRLYPEIYVDFRTDPNFPDYSFLGASLDRRLTRWSPLSKSPPIPPGPFLTQDGALAEQFAGSREVSVDRLSFNVWLLVPNDVLRLVFDVRRPLGVGPLLVSVRAAAPATMESPEYRFSLIGPDGEKILRDFAPEATFDVPIEDLSAIRVEARSPQRPTEIQMQYIGSDQIFGS